MIFCAVCIFYYNAITYLLQHSVPCHVMLLQYDILDRMLHFMFFFHVVWYYLNYIAQHHILICYNMIDALQIDCTKLHTQLLHLKTHTVHFRICIFGVSIVVCMNCLIYHRFSMYFSLSTDCLWFFCFRQCLQQASTSTSRSNNRLLSLVGLMISCKHHDAVIDDEWMWI